MNHPILVTRPPSTRGTPAPDTPATPAYSRNGNLSVVVDRVVAGSQMRCPKSWDTESSRNEGFSSAIIRSPKNLGHRIWMRIAEIAVPLDLTAGTLDPLYGTVSPHSVFPCPQQQTNGGGPGNQLFGSKRPMLGPEDSNVGGQATNGWVTGDPCLEAN